MPAPLQKNVLLEVVTAVLAVGSTEFEVEYDEGYEEATALVGPIGIEILKLKSNSKEAKKLRMELYDLRGRAKHVVVSGIEYSLRLRIFESFGEDAFHVRIERK